MNNIEYHSISNSILPVLAAKFIKTANGVQEDYAIIAVPWENLPAGYELYLSPYDTQEIPANIPANSDEAFFMIHHGGMQPQLLSQLSNAYDDVAKNKHSLRIVTTIPKFYDLVYWSNGSIYAGTSGAALIRPVGTDPRIVGILSSAFRTDDPGNFPAAIVAASKKDKGAWAGTFYQIKYIADTIRKYCGCTDEQAKNGTYITPLPGGTIPASISFTSQSEIIAHPNAHTILGIVNLNHVGNIIIKALLNDITANIHAEKGVVNGIINGNIYLGNGFKASSANNVALAIGLIESYVPSITEPLPLVIK